ncbi:MAG: hypothetical protein U1F46_05805 [Marinagarivorans sp.]
MSLAQAAPTRNAHEMHFAVAEYGKVMALQKNHTDALRHYREAIRMAVSIKAPEVFFRHYTQCVLESLELTGTYSDVIEFCENADRHYSALEVSRAVHKKDWASVLERLAINLVKAGQIAAAKEAIHRALGCAEDIPMPLAQELNQWLQRGLHVDNNRLLALQKKHHYFVVRPEQVNASQARSLESLNAPSRQFSL